MTNAQKIKEIIRKIAGGSEIGAFTAEVVSVEGDTCTVQVNSLQIPDIRLNAVSNDSTNKLIITPVVGSVVGIIDMGGESRDLTVFQFTEIDHITVNGGSNGGLVNINVLTAWMAKVKTDLTTISTALNGLGAPITITTDSPTGIEDKTFKH